MGVSRRRFCLPPGDDDLGWKAVIVTRCFDKQQPKALLTWVHPDCIRFLTNDELHRCSVVIGMTEGRGSQSWTHDIGPRQRGIRHVSSQLVLDARWRKTFAGRESCTGHCLDVFQAIVQVPEYFGTILLFAATLLKKCTGAGLVCCKHAKHRSVAVGIALSRLFHLRVDMSCCVTDASYRCCGSRAIDNLGSVFASFRSLPVLVLPSAELATVLNLPS